jgi:hypothetical protein
MTQRARHIHSCIAPAYARAAFQATSRQAGAGPVATAGRFAPSRHTLEGAQQ